MENVQFEYFWGGRLEHTLFEGGWEGLLLSSGLYKSDYHLSSIIGEYFIKGYNVLSFQCVFHIFFGTMSMNI